MWPFLFIALLVMFVMAAVAQERSRSFWRPCFMVAAMFPILVLLSLTLLGLVVSGFAADAVFIVAYYAPFAIVGAPAGFLVTAVVGLVIRLDRKLEKRERRDT